MHDGRNCQDNEWRTTLETLRPVIADRHMIVGQVITNCPAIVEELQRYRKAVLSLELTLRTQLKWDRDRKVIMNVVKPDDPIKEAGDAEERVPPEEGNEFVGIAWDDISGKDLDVNKVVEARKLEMGYYRNMEVYEKVPLSELGEDRESATQSAMDRHRQGPRYRSRWEWFAATPPIEALGMVISAATTRTSAQERGLVVMDVSQAFFYALVQHCIYVELCEEARDKEEDRNTCARLKKSMYGTKAAAQNWPQGPRDNDTLRLSHR